MNYIAERPSFIEYVYYFRFGVEDKIKVIVGMLEDLPIYLVNTVDVGKKLLEIYKNTLVVVVMSCGLYIDDLECKSESESEREENVQ